MALRWPGAAMRDGVLFCFEWYVCCASQFLRLILWWRAALLCVSRPTHHTTSPAKPQEPNLLLRSPGTETEKSWNLRFIPRYGGASPRQNYSSSDIMKARAGRNKDKAT